MREKRQVGFLLLAGIVVFACFYSVEWRGARAATVTTGRSWEYKRIVRSRDIGLVGTMGRVDITDWVVWEDEHQSADAFAPKLIQLGAQGWELVAVMPRSSTAGTMLAGLTSEEVWVFKRPRS